MNRRKFNAIRNEIRVRKNQLISDGENENNALNIARKETNEKYGKGWREKLLMNISSVSKSQDVTIYDNHTFGEHWID